MSTSRVSAPAALLTSGILLLAGVAGGYWLARQRNPAPIPDEGKSDERKVLYWHDPMVPGTRFDKPGKSPFMDMQLVPVYADELGSDSGVRVAPNVTQSLGVRLGKVEKARIEAKLRAVGTVAFNDQLQDVVAARAEGVISQLHVHAPLERVRGGQPLADVTSPAWIEAQREYLSLLEARSEVGRELQSAARERLRSLGLPEASIRKIESSRTATGPTTLVAPLDGVITELAVRQGSSVSPGMLLFRINGLTSVWVNARIPEAQRALVAVGSAVESKAVAWPGVTFRGRVIAVQSQVDAESRTITARIILDNKDRRLAPGMFVSAEILGAKQEAQLVVPDEAVIATGERSIVITANGEGRFGVAPVVTGASQDGRTVILEGLAEGQSVVLSGQFLIDSEASLKSTQMRLQSPQDMEHGP